MNQICRIVHLHRICNHTAPHPVAIIKYCQHQDRVDQTVCL